MTPRPSPTPVSPPPPQPVSNLAGQVNVQPNIPPQVAPPSSQAEWCSLPSRCATSEASQASRAANLGAPTHLGGQPTRSPNPFTFPSPTSPEYAKLEKSLAQLELPPIPETREELDVWVSNFSDSVRECLVAVQPPARISKAKRIAFEFHNLRELRRLLRAHDGDMQRAQDLLAQLCFTRRVLLPHPTLDLCERALAQLNKIQLTERNKKRPAPNITQLYFKNRKAAMRAVMGESGSLPCTIPEEQLFNHHSKVNQGQSSSPIPSEYDISPLTSLPSVATTQPRECTPEENSGEPFSRPELNLILKHANKKSAPGPDRIPIQLFLLGGEKFRDILLALFERCRLLQYVPDAWGTGWVQTIYKKGAQEDPGNWRPITLLGALYKLLMALWQGRVRQWDKILKGEGLRGLLSISQRGFRPKLSGCLDNAALLRMTLARARRLGKPTYAVFFDFKNAFGSPDHLLLWKVLEWYRLPSYLVNLVKSAYSSATIRIRWGEGGLSRPIAVQCGALQGCTASPMLFMLVVDLLLRALEGLRDGDVTGTAAAFADDILTLCEKKRLSQALVTTVEFFSNTVGMSINASKTAATVITHPASGRKAKNPHFLLYGKPLVGLQGAETYKFMGGEAGGSGQSCSKASASRLHNILQEMGPKLTSAVTKPWIKSALFQGHVSPKMAYILSLIPLSEPQRRKLDREVRIYARAFESKRRSFASSVIHAPPHFGGLGYTSIYHLACSRFVVPWLRRFYIGDAQIRRLQWNVIRAECERLASRPAPYAAHDWRDLERSPSLFTSLADDEVDVDIRFALEVLAKVGASFVDAESPNHPPLISHPDMSPNLPILKRLSWTARRIKAWTDRDSFDTWAALETQGSTLRAVGFDQLAPKKANCLWQSQPHRLSTSARHFAHSTQTGTLMCGSNLHKWYPARSATCVLCGAEKETPMHVLNMCQSRLPAFRVRHDACHKDIFVPAVARHLKNVSEHKVDITQGDFSTLRPDSVILFDKFPIPNSIRTEKRAIIVDFKCPYPTLGFIERTHSANVEKYTPIANHYRTKGYRVTIETMIIPSVGPNLKHAFNTLRRIGFTTKVTNSLLADMSIAVAKTNHATLAPSLPTFAQAPGATQPPPPPPSEDEGEGIET